MYVRRFGLMTTLLGCSVNSWSDTVRTHAADPATAKLSSYSTVTHYRSLCGKEYLSATGREFRETMHLERCTSCERIADKRYPAAPPNPHEDAIQLLEGWLAGMPKVHHERPGVIRAIEILRVYR